MLKGNKGEWSEVYVLLKSLADGKIYAADENLNKLGDIYFPIIKILREEIREEIKEYKTGETIEIYINGKKVKELSKEEFSDESSKLLIRINSGKAKGAFSIEETESFMNDIYCYKLSAPATDKTDITMKIVDINTGYSPTVGFSIKSELGSSPTLLNAGKTTNFIFEIIHNYSELVMKPMKYIPFHEGKIM